MQEAEIIEEINKYPSKSDKEIHEMAVADWYSILEDMWVAVGKEIDKERLLIYGKDLGNVPCELLERAIRRIRMTSIYSQVPTIGEIWQAVRMELAMDNCSTPEEWVERRWIQFMGRARYGEVNK